jgi:hypothetical protein
MAKTRPQDQTKLDTEEASRPLDGADADPTAIDARTLADQPDDPTGLHQPGEGSALPTQEKPTEGVEPAAAAARGGPSVEGPAVGREVHDPGGVVGDGPQAGLPGMEELDDLLAGEGGYGGADGRNDANDGGGPGDPDAAPPDFGAGGPVSSGGWHGLEGAAGKLPKGQQDVLNAINEKVQEAARAGDQAGVDQWTKAFVDYQVEIGVREPPPPPPGADTGEEPVHELVTNFGAGAPGETKQVWNRETGEMEEVPADTPTSHENMASGSEQMKQTGTDSQGNQETPTPSETPAEDREWEGEAPDLHGDFIDAYHRQQTGADAGGATDPDPNADPTSGVMDGTEGDYEPYVAEYEPGTGFTEEQVDQAAGRIDSTPDEEFMET